MTLKLVAPLAADFRARYVDFMTTEGTHNDTYASTYHRMFFANYIKGTAPEDCPDNDHHNVESMDALVGSDAAGAVWSHAQAHCVHRSQWYRSFSPT